MKYANRNARRSIASLIATLSITYVTPMYFIRGAFSAGLSESNVTPKTLRRFMRSFQLEGKEA